MFTDFSTKAPNDPCWPSESAWSSLNETLSGRLIRTVLPASVCYPDEPNYDQAACELVLGNWTASSFHSSDPTSVDQPMFANNSCNPIYLNGMSISGDPDAGKKGCQLGFYPPYAVNATEPDHVQAALKFIRQHNIRSNIKNTGHNGIK